MTKLPPYLLDHELTAVGTIARIVGVDRKTVDKLFAQVDDAYLRAIVRSDPDSHFELLLGDEITSLWYSDRRLAVVNAKEAP